MPFDGQTFTQTAPTKASLLKVREFDRLARELAAYANLPKVAAQRADLGIKAPPALRAATDVEITAIAAALDVGALIVPRLWNARFAEGAAPAPLPVMFDRAFVAAQARRVA